MNPILFDFGIIKIYWYSIFIFVALLIGGSLTVWEGKKYNFTEDFLMNYFFFLIPISLLGARLYYVIFNWSYYQNDLYSIIKVWEGGLAIHGALLFGLIWTIIYMKKYKVKPLLMTDIMVVGVILGQAIGRWGNFFNGEAHGGITTLENLEKMKFIPKFIIDGMYINGSYYQPTFLYESIWCFIGFIVIFTFRRMRYTKVGQTTALYLIWYGFGRFFIEAMRTDSLMLGHLKMAQIVSILCVVIGILLFIKKGTGNKLDNNYGDRKALAVNVKF